MLTSELNIRKVDAQLKEVVYSWRDDLKKILGLKVNFKFDFLSHSRYQLTTRSEEETDILKKRYNIINGGLQVVIEGDWAWSLFKELFKKLLYLHVNEKEYVQIDSIINAAEKTSFDKNRRKLFFSRALLISIIMNKKTIIPHWFKLTNNIDVVEHKRIVGISTSGDNEVRYKDDVTVVIADLETYKEISPRVLRYLRELKTNKELYKENMLQWNLGLRDFHRKHSKTVPYAAAWVEVKGTDIPKTILKKKDINVTFDLVEFCKYLYELSKRKNVLLIWYNAAYDTIVLTNYLREHFPEWNVTFQYEPWNGKSKFRQGLFNFNNQSYLESQDLYVFFRKRLSLTARDKNLTKGEIPYDMVNAYINEDDLIYYSENSNLEKKTYPLELIKDYAKKDILLTFDALKQKLEILNILNDTALEEFGVSVGIKNDYYGQSTTADAWVKAYLLANKKEGVKSFPAISKKGIYSFLKPKTSEPIYEALRLGIVAGLTSHNIFQTTLTFKDGFKVEEDEAIYYFDINSSYPYQMTKPLPFGKFFAYPPSKTNLLKRKKDVIFRKSKIVNDPSLTPEEKKKRLEWLDDSVLLLDESLPLYTFYTLKILISNEELENLKSKYEYDHYESSPLLPLHKWKQGQTIIIPEELYEFYLDRFGKEQFDKSFEFINKLYKYQSKALSELINFTYYNLRVKYKNKNPVISDVFKLVLNSIFGKRMQKAFPTSYKFNFESSRCDFQEIDNELDPLKDYLDPATGSVIACRARLYLKEIEDKLHKHCKSTVSIYKDTDSLLIKFKDSDLPIANKIIDFHPTKLGAWKLEGIFDTWFCKRNKCYLVINQSIDIDKLNKRAKSLSNNILEEYKSYKVALGGIDRKELFNEWIESHSIKEIIKTAKLLWHPNNYVSFPNLRVEEVKANEAVFRTPILYNKSICFARLDSENTKNLTHEAKLIDGNLFIESL